jgi:hypothetical protein
MSEIREVLEGAFEAAETSTTPAPEAAPVADATPAPVVEAKTETKPEGRDDKGRFAPKAKTSASATAKPVTPEATATPAPAPAEAASTPAPVESTPTPTLKAPANWKPAAREKWAQLPPEVQAEAVRVHHEVQKTLQETTQARRTAEALDATVRPYLPLIQAEGGDVMRAVGSLLQTAAALRTAPPAHKAQLVAQLIKTYGVPVDALDAALVGETSQANHAPPEYRDPRVDQMLSALQAQKAAQAKAEQDRAAAEVESFKAEAEFLDDVREDMADLIEVARRRGVALSLKDAYSRAVAMNPDVAEALRQREAAKAAQTANAATAKARAASSSVRSSPAAAPSKSDDSIRALLEAGLAARSR